ncbi:Septation protein imp2 [Colletotrichum gloeosporioides]|uniref:Septation protein imp2 n=1 Tax=Colletotrichum gloeosporioides TaxID=474922 RepID=A0A8H4CCW0_COLGL|nr:Septation protein imp2 [Colletotrichum gloeosporioides]KAF3801688.1 Septation protein imp2 [Colletotrichum gloeosporioides]
MESPAVALSFANNFWGKEDAGVGPLLDRMAAAKQTCDELKAFYSARASIEDEYARKLLSLCRKSLGSQEMGSLKNSLDTVRGEVESMGKQHQNIAAQMKTELEEPLAAFAGAMKERRKIVQNGIEKILKTKIQQTQHVNKTRDRFEQECLKIKGYLAQGHMVMGQEERKNKAKLEKTQISVATSNTEYENAVKALEDTTARWNREWKAAADKFQDLEEERLDFTKSSLWTFANVSSTVCVSDDASCEKIRLSLEKMDVETDIVGFIKERGTGQEIPDPPKYINFCRGDVNDTQSETSDDDNYSVAQFPRSINPAFRTSSPQPSTYESHHDPNSSLAQDLGHKEPAAAATRTIATDAGRKEGNSSSSRHMAQDVLRKTSPPSRSFASDLDHQDVNPTPRTFLSDLGHKEVGSSSRGFLTDMSHREATSSSSRGFPSDIGPKDPILAPRSLGPDYGLKDAGASERTHSQEISLAREIMPPVAREAPSLSQRMPPQLEKQRQVAPAPPASQQQSRLPLDINQHGTFASVPHDPYPLDGMTMLCRKGPPSERSSHPASARPSSRDSQSDYSNPTSLSSQEPPSGKVSPIKHEQVSVPASVPAQAQAPSTASATAEKQVLKKKSGFFQNHSPFRRKSTKEVQGTTTNRNTWHPVSTQGSPSRRPQVYTQDAPNLLAGRSTISPEPIDANASLALNVGQNVFSVTTPDLEKRKGSNTPSAQPETDPIALALAELKGVGVGKQSSIRVSADRYHGIATPTPGSQPFSRSMPPAATNAAVTAGLRGTPPPSYDQQVVQRLGVPPQAVTAKAMKETSQKFADQTRSMFNPANRPGSGGYAGSSSPRPMTRGSDVPRAASPAPLRSASPRAPATDDSRTMSATIWQFSLLPWVMIAMARFVAEAEYDQERAQATGPWAYMMVVGHQDKASRDNGVRVLQIHLDSTHTTADQSCTLVTKALYMYQAAIPEELGFSKGDFLAVLRHQDDGWWEAEEALSKASRAATSKTAQRALVNVTLLVGTSLLLLPLAATASLLFFRNYLPDQVVSAPVHLQYGSGINPFGIATIPSSSLRTQQEYDVSVTLSLPRSPANTHRGNFMVALYLLDAGALSTGNSQVQPQTPPEPYGHFDGKSILFSSRRPTLVPYQDPLVSLASRVLFMVYHILFSNSQTCVLTVPMAERVQLGKGSSLPSSAYLEIQGGQSIETYDASITLTAQLRGLRWLMYHYRLSTLTAAIILFWSSEILFMAGAWLVWSGLSGSSSRLASGRGEDNPKLGMRLKREEGSGVDELSDAPRTFPTYGNQAPLRYEPEVKEEPQPGLRMEDLVPLGGEADDEEEDDGRASFKGDSGIGTSYSEGGSGSVRRRSSHNR